MEHPEILVKTNNYRAISTQHPPINLFENLCQEQDYEQACYWEMFTNPRIRNTIIPYEECVFGPGASYVMAPFFYRTPPARFSTDYFGGYYASKDELTSIYEKAYHLSDFISATEHTAFSEGLTILILKSAINTHLHDLTSLPYEHPVYNKHSYNAAQEIAATLYDNGSNGIYYKSVRKKESFCFVVFKPKKVKIPTVTKKIPLHFDGNKIDKFFDNEKWKML